MKTGRLTNSQAQRFQATIKEAFPEAMVEVTRGLVEIMTHPGDRHIVAAAIASVKSIIVER